MALTTSEIGALPPLLRRLHRTPGFEAWAGRAGKVVRLTLGAAHFYQAGDP